MYAKRALAYNMAMNYASNKQIKWDLVVFMRFDSAIYSPILDFPSWIKNLNKFKAEGSEVILSPRNCNFGGILHFRQLP